ncbi:MAG TPA: T9SS type A sorting domain-containing protein [Bacteroidia bacterium]|jgi:hypothetical protein
MKKIYTLSLSFSVSLFSFAQSTGFMPPTSTAAPNGFTNANLAFASDDQWATVAHQSGCRCPFIYLSWNGGTNYTSSQLLGPFGTTDQTSIAGSPTDTWGHPWTDTELSNTNFRLKIANPSTLIEQGYSDFNFTIPTGATINGIEVQLEWHGDANFTQEFLDQAMVNVFYTATTGIPQTIKLSQNISVYPVPAHDRLIIDLKDVKCSALSIIDLQGREVLSRSSSDVADQTLISLSVSDLPKGMYFLRITENNAVQNKKIIIE